MENTIKLPASQKNMEYKFECSTSYEYEISVESFNNYDWGPKSDPIQVDCVHAPGQV